MKSFLFALFKSIVDQNFYNIFQKNNYYHSRKKFSSVILIHFDYFYFIQLDALKSLLLTLVTVDYEDENISVFLLEILLDITIQNRDRVACIWQIVQTHLDDLLTTSARENYPYLMERVTVGMLRLAIRLLRGEELEYSVFPLLIPLAYLPSASSPPLSRQISYGLFELLKIGAANIHNAEDWKVVFSLLECSGAGALQPKQSNDIVEEAVTNKPKVSSSKMNTN